MDEVIENVKFKCSVTDTTFFLNITLTNTKISLQVFQILMNWGLPIILWLNYNANMRAHLYLNFSDSEEKILTLPSIALFTATAVILVSRSISKSSLVVRMMSRYTSWHSLYLSKTKIHSLYTAFFMKEIAQMEKAKRRKKETNTNMCSCTHTHAYKHTQTKNKAVFPRDYYGSWNTLEDWKEL